jgi:hypothetical protein
MHERLFQLQTTIKFILNSILQKRNLHRMKTFNIRVLRSLRAINGCKSIKLNENLILIELITQMPLVMRAFESLHTSLNLIPIVDWFMCN